MARHRWDPKARHPGTLARAVRADSTGRLGPTRSVAQRGHFWRRTSHGFYVPIDAPTDLPEQRIMEQSARLPTNGAVTGWAGCRLHGAQFFDGFAADRRTRVTRHGIASLEQIRNYSAGRRLGARVREGLALASEHSRSPNESRLRLIWVLDAGLPAPVVNCPIRARNGRLLGIADLVDLGQAWSSNSMAQTIARPINKHAML